MAMAYDVNPDEFDNTAPLLRSVRHSYGASSFLAHRLAAAAFAIAVRSSGVRRAIRRFPPFVPPSRPSATAAAFFSRGVLAASASGAGVATSSPCVASFTTRNAVRLTSSSALGLLGRFGIPVA